MPAFVKNRPNLIDESYNRPELAEQVRKAILPLNGPSFIKSALSSPAAALSFGSPTSDIQNDPKDYPIATYHVRTSALDKLQSLLLAGNRREACHYALDQKLWAHAMIISNNMDKEIWKDVVNEFIRSELGVPVNIPSPLALRRDLAPSSSTQEASNGRESLRVVYSLFSGQGTAAGTRFRFKK